MFAGYGDFMTTKKELIEFYAECNKITDLAEAEEKIDKFLEVFKIALSQNKNIIFRRFGNFEVRKTTERYIVDPKNSGNIIHAKPRKYVKFKVSKCLESDLCLQVQE